MKAMLKFAGAVALFCAAVMSVQAQNAACKAALANIMTRTSVRSYQNKAVPKELETIMLKAAMAAPTAMNQQPWAFVVVRDAEVLKKLAAAMPNAKMAAKAPLAIMVCADLTKLNKFSSGNTTWIQDTSAATENLLLAAHALGLGAVWCGVYPSDARVKSSRDILKLPANVVPACLVVIGYPAREHKPKDKWKPERIHYNCW